MSTPTPHNEAKKGDFAETVLMPGDPLRSKFIAENFLENAVLVNNVRGIQGYTGEYKGKRVSVMASGMGMPSMGIYSYELFNFYDVKQIIRIGSCGALQPEMKLRDIVIAMSACTDSNYFAQFGVDVNYAPTADFDLLNKAVKISRELGIEPYVGTILSHDLFYDESGRAMKLQKMGVLAVEMETAALYMNAKRAGKKALSICTVSDSLCNKGECTSEEREKTFTKMMEIALNLA